ncbi:restriction endonuclease subunit S [Hornefia butyriciproducens]|uniref:Restriction endonuclease subunit S n=1 Tax=Hornefia butyriciproducens TaxID=2652293 RepID=A0A6L5Y2H0_9FIRM|nr:restriction endonuclease subunit S [Hornefia butyriciproducens]MST50984.1 restriction endonuclease subunit S [Hornefia butyriciproducens]
MKYKLSDICEYAKGKIKVSALDENTYISTENMLPNKGGITKAASLPTQEQTQAFMKNDVLVSNIRPYFKKIWYATFDGGCSNDVLVFRAKDGVNSRFLHYVLADDTFFDYSMATSKGTKMPRGDKKAIMEYEVPELSYEDQCKIAGILEVIDEKIELNTDINKNLEQQAQAYFLDLFVTNPDPNWQSGTLSDLGTVVGGGTPSKKHPEYYIETGIPWITPKDLSIDKSKFISRGENDISELGFSNSSATKMAAGTILFSSRAPIGYIAIALNTVTTNQGFKSVIPNTNVGSAFMYFFLKQALPTIEGMASGSTFKEISGSGMKSVPAVIPDDETLHKYNEFCQPLFEQQAILEAENRRLSGIRDALLPKLMSGEIDVSNIDL